VQMAADAGVSVVDTRHSHVDRAADEQARQALPTARNAIETAALHSFRQRSGQKMGPTQRNVTVDGTGDTLEDNEEFREYMTDEQKELIEVRDGFDTEISELGAAISEMQEHLDTIDEDIATAVTERDTAVEAFLPDDQVPQSVTTETRDIIASYLDTLGEKQDVRRETMAMKTDRVKTETKRAGEICDDIDEITAAVDRLGEQIDEAKSRVNDARQELDTVRSQLEDDLKALTARIEPFGIDLTLGTLEKVIETQIPEHKDEMRASLERTRERVTELSARKTKLTEDRDKLQSIDGGGTCPTCDQDVGPDRSEGELKAIWEELHHVKRRLGGAERERDEMIAGIEELDDIRAKLIRLRSFRSETVAQAEGRVEDCQANVEDLQADLEEERSELTEAKEERDKTDAAAARLESEIGTLVTEIDRLQAKTDQGEACLAAFEVVDELRAQREELAEELRELQAESAEKEAERASLGAEIEALADE